MALEGREYRKWLKEQAKRRALIKADYRREQSLAIVARLHGVTRARIQQIVKNQ